MGMGDRASCSDRGYRDYIACTFDTVHLEGRSNELRSRQLVAVGAEKSVAGGQEAGHDFRHELRAAAYQGGREAGADRLAGRLDHSGGNRVMAGRANGE